MSPFPFQINTILAAEVVAAMPMNKNLELHALPFQVAKETLQNNPNGPNYEQISLKLLKPSGIWKTIWQSDTTRRANLEMLAGTLKAAKIMW